MMTRLLKFQFPSQQKQISCSVRGLLLLTCGVWLWISKRSIEAGCQKYGVLRAQVLQDTKLTMKALPCCASLLTPLSKSHRAYVVLWLLPKLYSLQNQDSSLRPGPLRRQKSFLYASAQIPQGNML